MVVRRLTAYNKIAFAAHVSGVTLTFIIFVLCREQEKNIFFLSISEFLLMIDTCNIFIKIVCVRIRECNIV